jgi:hypothetical protein
MLLCLYPDQVALQPGQGLFPFLHRQPQRFRRAFGRCGAAGTDLVQLHGSLSPGQFDHDRHFIPPSRSSTSRSIHRPPIGRAVGPLHREHAAAER